MTTHDRDKIIAAAKEAGIDVNRWVCTKGNVSLKEFYAIAYEDGRASRDAEIATLREKVTLLRDAVRAELLGADYGRRAMREALAATEPK